MIPSKEKKLARSGAMALGFLLAALLVAAQLSEKPAHAAFPILFIVNNTADPGDGNCTASGCTLREAINEANAFPGKDAIHFDIPGGGVKTIEPDSKLPRITDEVTIDGYTQPGASPNTKAKGTNAVLKIELNGENAGPFLRGFEIESDNSVVKGLVINRFADAGVELSGSNNKLRGNFIGTNPGGTLDRGNGDQGVTVRFEGTSGNTIGGATPAARNLISGNNYGISISHSAANNEIKGNLIGTKKDGTGALGNSASGVLIEFGGVPNDDDTFNNTVGGNTSSTANTIAFNGEDGVRVIDEDSTGNSILRNSMFSNDHSGIDLGDDGPTANDPDDPDIGPNNLQNKPNLTSAVTASGSTTIEGSLNSTPGETFKVQLYSNPPTGGAEGKKYIGQKSVSTNANGNTGIFSFSPAQKVPEGHSITATATDPDGNTSEFSTAQVVV
jgi:CSLREA domain-containing protein